jgi:hypothetical protein
MNVVFAMRERNISRRYEHKFFWGYQGFSALPSYANQCTSVQPFFREWRLLLTGAFITCCLALIWCTITVPK